MSAAQRVDELGELLAAAVQRLLARDIKPVPSPNSTTNRQEQLDAVGPGEAQCGRSPETAA